MSVVSYVLIGITCVLSLVALVLFVISKVKDKNKKDKEMVNNDTNN